MGVSPIAVPQSLAQVLNSAGDRSNVDFDYLLQTAIRESSLDPAAKAPTSSAVGLFQFLESTWLQVMKEAGPRLGYQRYADAISVDAEGDYVIRNKALRKQILALREDPQVAADMAAAFTQSNGAYLRETPAACRAPASSISPTSSDHRVPKTVPRRLAGPRAERREALPPRRAPTRRFFTARHAASASSPRARRPP